MDNTDCQRSPEELIERPAAARCAHTRFNEGEQKRKKKVESV